MSLSSTFSVIVALFTVTLVTRIRDGSSLKCYVCSSLLNNACSSTLDGIEATTCTSNLLTTSTSVSDESTVIGEMTGLTEDAIFTVETTDSDSSTESSELVQGSTSETANFTGSSNVVSDTTTIDEENEEETGSKIYLHSRTVERYFCYTIIYHRNNTDVTERGCYTNSSMPCSILGEEDTVNNTLKECRICDEDACNSSSSIDLRPTIITLLLTIFLLTRYTISS